MEDELDLREYWLILRRRLWLVALATLLAAAVAFLAGRARGRVYTAEATLGIIPSRTEVIFQSAIRTASGQEAAVPVPSTQERRQTLAQVALSPDVAEAVWRQLGTAHLGGGSDPQDILDWVSVDTPRDRDLITIRVIHPDPQTAARVASAWADEAARHINDRYSNQALTQDVSVQVSRAKAEYDQAQAALVDFLGANDLERLRREISERRVMVQRLNLAVAARTLFVEQEVESRKQAVADLYARAQKLDRLIADARSLREQVTAAGTSSASATANALSLMILQIGAYTMGAAPLTLAGVAEIQLSVDGLVGSPVEPQDVDTLISLLEVNRAQVRTEIRILAGRLVREGGAEFLFVPPSWEDPLLAAVRERYPQLLAGQPSSSSSLRDDPLAAALGSLEAEIQTLEQELERQSALRKELEQGRDLAWEKYTSLARRLEEVRLTSETEGTVVRVVATASVPATPVPQRAAANTALAAIVGLVLAVGAVFVLAYLDDRVRTTADVSQLLDLRPLGAVPMARESAPNGPAWLSRARTPEGEALRMIRTNIQVALPEDFRALLFLGPEVGEGKSTIVSSLAQLFAEAGRKTILVDADLRRPALHRLLGVSNDAGLSNLLAGNAASVAEVLQKTEWPTLGVVSSGPSPPNPAELLASPRLAEVLAALRQRADLVLIDAPAGLAVTDGLLLAKAADAVILVAEAGRTSRSVLRELRAALEETRAPVLGLVLNKVKGEQARRYGYYTGSGPQPPSV